MSSVIHISRRNSKAMELGQRFKVGNTTLTITRCYKNGFEGTTTDWSNTVITYVFKDTWYRHELLPNTYVAEGYAIGSFSPLNPKP